MKAKQLVGIILLFGLSVLLIFSGTLRAQGQEDRQAAALNRLREDSKQPPKIRFEGGIPRFVSVEVPVPSGTPDDPVVRALNFLDKYRDLYLLQDPRSQLFLDRIVTNELGQHLFFGQRRDEVPVFAAELAVHLSKDAVIATNGNYLTDIPVFPPPAIDETRAEKIAIENVARKDVRRLAEPKLVYFNARLFITPTDVPKGELDIKTHQAWQLTVADSGVIAWTYFIDTQTGAVLFRLDLSPTHAPSKNFNIRTANNTGGGPFCGFPSATDWFDQNGVRTGASPDAEGNNAFNFAHQVYDFYYNNFHQHSWDGNEAIYRIILDDSDEARNAAFISICNHFAFGNNIATLDVLAHETTHGVTATSAGLIYENQPGALNESYSDVFAAMIDTANWTIGEGSGIGTLRSMSSPSAPAFCDPDHMLPSLSGEGPTCPKDSAGKVIKGFRPLPAGQGPECNPASPTFNDCGFVHTNSGIPNKVAFLIAAGGTHNGIKVNGLGRPKTAYLYYIVLTSFLTLNADFASAATDTILVAQTFSRTGSHGFTAADACDVVNAYASVGLGLPDLDCDGVDDTADSDDDGDTIGDSVDNCPRVSNPGQADTDTDGMGDACDTDADNDGVPNSTDNCVYVPNPGQADKTSDGFGDVCQDSDFDGVLDSVDNCLFSSNPSQLDFDKDGIGDACDPDDDNDSVNTIGDNCPLVFNPSQADADKDGVGDACDSCPTTADTPFDTDNDKINNACDPDDDNDAIPDATDNCPLVSNPDQQDLNGNGIGHACDPDETIKLGVSPDVIQGALQFRQAYFEKFQILILPNLSDFGRDWIPEHFFSDIKVEVETDLPMRITDDQGFVVATSQGGPEKGMRFYPKADFFYRPPSSPLSGEIKAYQGRQYFLEIFPTVKIERDRAYKIRIEAASGIDQQAPTGTEPLAPTSPLQDARVWLGMVGAAGLLLIGAAWILRKRP